MFYFSGNTVKRALPLSKNSRDALGQDLFIYLNAPLNPGEVRQMLQDRAVLEAQIRQLGGTLSPTGADPVGEIGQLTVSLRQMNDALGAFFSAVWMDAAGNPIPGETVMALHSIVGPAETQKMMTDTLSAMEAYQGMNKAGAMGSEFTQSPPTPKPEKPAAGTVIFDAKDVVAEFRAQVVEQVAAEVAQSASKPQPAKAAAPKAGPGLIEGEIDFEGHTVRYHMKG